MSGTILVTGGTGNLGRPLVECLRQHGVGVRVPSRCPAPGEPGAAGQETGARGPGEWATPDPVRSFQPIGCS